MTRDQCVAEPVTPTAREDATAAIEVLFVVLPPMLGLVEKDDLGGKEGKVATPSDDLSDTHRHLWLASVEPEVTFTLIEQELDGERVSVASCQHLVNGKCQSLPVP